MNDQSTPFWESPVKRFIPGIAWFFLILVLISLPGSKLPTVETWLNDIYFDKWIHTGLFAILVLLFIYPVSRTSLPVPIKKNIALKIAIAACIWGLTTEFIQKFFIPDRSFDLFDLAADCLGVLLAYAWCRKKLLK
ncbi:MAG TPA: VanZ family protein [Ferruginibacter sp.]|jgi:VanZ family protein|nr:VanZ family protein [Ferruginibacter sp.]